MCGSRPKPPKTVYQGPSRAEIAQQEATLAEYRSNTLKMQAQMAEQLQAQIDSTRAATAQRAKELEAVKTEVITPNTVVEYGLAEDTSTKVTTTATTAKKKPKDSSLRIGQATTPATAGSGINIGV